MITWVRIDRGIHRDPKVLALSEGLSRPVDHVVGLLVRLFAEAVVHAPDGDLSSVTDTTLEAWVEWRGKRGRFSAEYRRMFAPDNKINAWERHNGKSVEIAKATAERVRQHRERKAAGGSTNGVRNANGTRDVTRTQREQNALEVSGVEVRGEVQDQKQLPARGASASPSRRRREPAALKPGAKYPHFSPADRQAVHAAWEKHIGPVDVGRLVREFAPAFAADPLPFTLPELAEAIDCARVEAICLDTARKSTIERASLTPERFVRRLNEHLAHARSPMVDPVTRRPTEWGAFVERWYGVGVAS